MVLLHSGLVAPDLPAPVLADLSALTARLHGSGVEVVVCRSATRLTTTVTNPPPLAPIVPVEPGRGLIGMRERARIYHGTLTTGFRENGGYRVELVVPLGGTTAVTSHG